MIRTRTFIGIPWFFSLVVFAPATLSLAETLPAQGPVPFPVFDADGNGVISEAEFDNVHNRRLQARAEQGRPARGAADAPLFADFDSDGDGGITPEELNAAQRARVWLRHGPNMAPRPGTAAVGQMPAFAEFDLDANGFLEEQEFEEARARRIKQRSAQGYPMRNLQNAPPFSAIDSDGDGRISPREFSEHQAQQQRRMPRR